MGIGSFISEHALSLHREYLSSLMARRTMGMEKGNALDMEIRSHELFFSSFRRDFSRCERACRGYGSENAFLFALSEYAETQKNCFLYIFSRQRYPYVAFSTDGKDAFRAALCVDLFEHAYFLDYGFDKNAYLRAALSRMDLSLLDKNFHEKGKNSGN